MADIVIIGGGIVGLCSAYYLNKDGHRVTVLDKGDITGNCSYGNAGMIVPSHFVPMASPGMINRGIRWMFDSKSPFYVRPSFSRELIGWGLQFMRHANAKHVKRSAAPLRDLSLLSHRLYTELAAQPGFDVGLRHRGILAFFKTEKTGEEESHLVEDARALGLDMAVLNPAECKALQPGLELDVLGAVQYRCDSHLTPMTLMDALQKHLAENGVTVLKHHEVDGVEIEKGVLKSVLAGGRKFTADRFVLAAGAWSPEVAKTMGIGVSLMPGKGYSFLQHNPNGIVEVPALLCEARVAVTPMDGRIRFGGTMELGRMNDKINMNRVEGIVSSIPAYFPNLNVKMPAAAEVWHGFRPSSPDGLPYIGLSKKLKNLVLATGHGMMGLSLGPATGLVVSQLITEKPAAISLTAFSPDRF